MSQSPLSEFELIRRYFTRPTPSAVLGPGDDCALIAPSLDCELAITTDMLVEGTHFLADCDAEALGWKTLAVNLSDLAAMGATPRWALLAGSLPQADEAWLAAFTRGFFALADEHGVELIGGDTTRGPRNLCLTAIGEVPAGRALRRDGAKPGDEIWVSGRPGLAALGLAEITGKTKLAAELREICLAALHRPQPRLALGLALRDVASAVIDVSDGLLGDLTHILERSACAAEVFIEALPALPFGADPTLARRAQISGGDDYELVFSAPGTPECQIAIADIGRKLDLPLTRIGRVLAAADGMPALRVRDAAGRFRTFDTLGYDHFA